MAASRAAGWSKIGVVRRCIYCLSEKPAGAFNREHVIPQAFGVFKDNLVVECVCTDCNDFFGRELDMKVARDAVEGMERFRRGLKKVSDFKSLGEKSTSRVEVMREGPLMGVLCVPRPSTDGVSFVMTPLPQIGFAHNEAGPFQYFLLNQLPTREEFAAAGFERGSSAYIRVWGTTLTEALARMNGRGTLIEERAPTTPPSGTVEVDLVFTISHPEYRAFTKIAMNYLAHMTDGTFVLQPMFNRARRYVRYGDLPSSPIVSVLRAAPAQQTTVGLPPNAHVLSVGHVDGVFVGQVSLLWGLRYLVQLSDGPVDAPFALRKMHIFDLDALRALEVSI